MGLLGKFKTNRDDPLLPQAAALVEGARAHAIASFEPLSTRFPQMREIDLEQWDFIVTVAGVFMGSNGLIGLSVDASREARLMDVVTEHAETWKLVVASRVR